MASRLSGRKLLERRDPHERRLDIAAVVASICACLLMAAAVVLLLNLKNRLHEQQDELGTSHVQLVDSCVRLQVLRVQDNISNYADYTVFKVVYDTSRLQVRRLSTRERAFQNRFLHELHRAIRVKTWQPLTDCAVAVALHGARYLPPRPVRFVDRLPPRAALTVPAVLYRK